MKSSLLLSMVWCADVRPGTVAAVLPPSGKLGCYEAKPPKRAEQRNGHMVVIKPLLKN